VQVSLTGIEATCISGVSGFVGTVPAEWDAIDDFYGNLYPLLVRHANMRNLALDPADIAADVEEGCVESYLTACLYLRPLLALKKLADDSKDPALLDFTQYIHRRRAYIERVEARLESFPFPPLYRQWIDYLTQPVTVAPGHPFILGTYNETRTQRARGSTTVIESTVAAAETAMDAIENSADKLKFLNALQSFKPAWSGPWTVPPAVVDPERVLMWRTRAIRNTNGLTDRQSPNTEDSGWGNGTRIPLFTLGNPHPFQFTGIVPAITWELDDKTSGTAAYGSTRLQGNTGDDADGPSELTVISGRHNAAVNHYPLDFANDVANIGTKLWDQWFYYSRTRDDDPSDYFSERIFNSIQFYEMELDDIGVETRRMITEAWALPL
jgi:hypothetical protein